MMPEQTKAADLDRATALIAQLAPHQLPLFRAVRRGEIALVQFRRGEPCKIGPLRRLTKPAVALIPDDDHLSSGPAAWPAAWPLIRWARGFIVHGTGGEQGHYELAVVAAIATGRLLLIETDSAHLPAWAALVPPRAPRLLIEPPNAMPHPSPIDKRDLQ